MRRTIGVTGTIDVGVMTAGSLVLDVLLISRVHERSKWTYRSGDGDTSSLLLRCFVNSTVVHEFSTVLLGQMFCDGSSQCRLSVINVLSVSSRSSVMVNSNIHQWYQCYIRQLLT